MATDDILRQLVEDAKVRASELDLPALYYPIEEAANILNISRSKLYRYLRDREFQIEPLEFENDRRSYVLSEDIRRLFIILHTPYIKKHSGRIRPPQRAPMPPEVSASNGLPRMMAISPRN